MYRVRGINEKKTGSHLDNDCWNVCQLTQSPFPLFSFFLLLYSSPIHSNESTKRGKILLKKKEVKITAFLLPFFSLAVLLRERG